MPPFMLPSPDKLYAQMNGPIHLICATQLITKQPHWVRMDLYFLTLCSLCIVHFPFGLGNLMKAGYYYPATWLVDGKPGTGETGIERLLEFVFGLWYTGSITGVLITYFFSTPAAVQGALISPLFYHVTVAMVAFLLFDKNKICNRARTSGTKIGCMHVLFSAMCAYLFYYA